MDSQQNWTTQQIGTHQRDGIESHLCAPYESSGAQVNRWICCTHVHDGLTDMPISCTWNDQLVLGIIKPRSQFHPKNVGKPVIQSSIPFQRHIDRWSLRSSDSHLLQKPNKTIFWQTQVAWSKISSLKWTAAFNNMLLDLSKQCASEKLQVN